MQMCARGHAQQTLYTPKASIRSGPHASFWTASTLPSGKKKHGLKEAGMLLRSAC